MKKVGLALILTILLPLSLFAQSSPRNPRAAEIEKNLQNDLQNTLHNLIPGKPFFVSVRIDPLRRASAREVANRDSLPYYDAADDIRDEWDDPAKSDFELLNRVNRIAIKATVPDSLNPNQLAEIKSALTKSIPYVEGRDSVEVESKDWPMANTDSRLNSTILAVGFGALSVIGIIYFIISNLAAGKLSKAIQNIKVQPGEGAGAAAPMPLPAATSPTEAATREGRSLGGDQIHFNDTLKMTEIVLDLIKQIQSSAAFPVLEDMVILEKYVELHPQSVGALFSEFPHAIRNRLFSFTSSPHWLRAFTDPGKMDAISFEIITKLTRIDRTQINPAWQELLISCWRLQDDLLGFLRKIDPKDALMILQALPQSLSIKVARELLPGEWAVILKKNPPAMHAPEKIVQYMEALSVYKPLRSLHILEQYRKDMELVLFLRAADPQIEKEIYGALPAESSLFQLRPPFYQVLDADPETIKNFVNQVPLEEWALSLMNIPKSQRAHIDSCFYERQKMRFVELLKAYDKMSPSAEKIGRARERIASLFSDRAPAPSPAENAAQIREAA